MPELPIGAHVLTVHLPPEGFRAYIFSDRCSQNVQQIFSNFKVLKILFLISLKYSNLGITPVKITENLRNSEKNQRKFDENLQSLPSPSKINKIARKINENCKNYAIV